MPEEIIHGAEERMKRAITALSHEFTTVRTGRASGAILEKVTLDYYGAPTPLLQLAGVSAPEPQLLVISPYDKSMIGAIEKAILASDLGLNPSNDGIVVRVPFPSLTEERRRELVKLCHTYAEQARVAVRNARRDANEAFKKQEKDSTIGQDDARRGEAEVQKRTDTFVKDIDDLLKRKEQEIMEV
ncbi:MAG: ribosome recycling factor [Coriobacteriia bacterium]|jgi:ribosome recycling factor|nr:ribosome recycling factor [Coriobacteriia bacterium]